MYSTHNEGKSVVVESFIVTPKNKIRNIWQIKNIKIKCGRNRYQNISEEDN